MKFTTSEKTAGEMAIRRLSAKAFKIYSETDPLDVYERDDLLYVRGCIVADGITLDKLEQMLVDLWEEEA